MTLRDLVIAYRDAWQRNRDISSDAPGHVLLDAHLACRDARNALFAALDKGRETDEKSIVASDGNGMA